MCAHACACTHIFPYNRRKMIALMAVIVGIVGFRLDFDEGKNIMCIHVYNLMYTSIMYTKYIKYKILYTK